MDNEKDIQFDRPTLFLELDILLFLLKHEEKSAARVYFNEYLHSKYPFHLRDEQTKEYFYLFDKINSFFNNQQYQENFPTSAEEIASEIDSITKSGKI